MKPGLLAFIFVSAVAFCSNEVERAKAQPVIPKAASADAPELNGPKEAPYLIEVKVSGVPKGTAILWDLYWKDSRTGLFYSEGKAQTRILKTEQSFIFAGPSGEYRVRCRLVKGEDSSELRWEGKLTAGGVAPNPNPNPPGPNPSPTLKGIAKVSADGLALVKDANKIEVAKTLAGNTRSLASAIAAGGQPDPSSSDANAKAVLKQWGDDVKAALKPAGASEDAWDAWATPVAKEFFALYSAKKLNTKAAWVEAFNDIATGLGN